MPTPVEHQKGTRLMFGHNAPEKLVLVRVDVEGALPAMMGVSADDGEGMLLALRAAVAAAKGEVT
jgi:hypothetical protein